VEFLSTKHIPVAVHMNIAVWTSYMSYNCNAVTVTERKQVNNMCTEDSGREIEVIAGVRHSATSDTTRKSSKSSSTAETLFEVIEDIELRPIMTSLYVRRFPVTFIAACAALANVFVLTNSLRVSADFRRYKRL